MNLGESRVVNLFIEDDMGDVDDGHLKTLAAEAKAAEEPKAAEELSVAMSVVTNAVVQAVSESYENDGA